MPQFIQNFTSLATSEKRTIALDLVETAFAAVQPASVLNKHFNCADNTLTIQGKTYDLTTYKRVFLVGFGKGSSGICKIVEKQLGDKLTEGFDIDLVDETFTKVQYTKGTHPLPSQTNIDYTQNVLTHLANLTEQDLVIVVICGGGSAMFEQFHSVDLQTLDKINTALLDSGAPISEINVIRKHLSKVKGGGFAKLLYPATIVSLIFSDVPGNNLSVIASGPTVPDESTLEDVSSIWNTYNLKQTLPVSQSIFEETPTEEKYFEHVSNILMVSNKTALDAMQEKAKSQGYKAIVLTDRLQGDAKKIGRVLLAETKPREIMFAGGETTIKVTGKGRGGRNQSLVLAALPFIENQVLVAFGSDGWDFTTFAGAIGDKQTVENAAKKGLDIKTYLDDDNSTEFFEKVGDGILTGKLESNVSDLYIILNI